MTKITKDDFDTINQLTDEGTKEYFIWLRHILTLSLGSLTLLVALQNQFLPAAPQALFLLKLSWILFAASIILALFALAGNHLLQFHTAREYFRAAKSQETNVVRRTEIPEPYKTIGRIVPWVFVAAVVALTCFGIVNLNPQNKTIPANGKNPASISNLPNNK